MKSERKIEILVGFVVTLSFVTLTLGLIWGKGMSLFSKQQKIVARFDDIRGLEEGDPVVITGQGFLPTGNTALFGTILAAPATENPAALLMKVTWSTPGTPSSTMPAPPST